jgi:hypothetical protein
MTLRVLATDDKAAAVLNYALLDRPIRPCGT